MATRSLLMMTLPFFRTNCINELAKYQNMRLPILLRRGYKSSKHLADVSDWLVFCAAHPKTQAKNPGPCGPGFFFIDAWQFPTLTWGDPT
ncbi:hypothetical protein, partial [Lelliottia amnigena]|uniref:hypothetical protein n=1 Tax=Lelliottia amnigena TaxID=61646 RepID=UPI0019824BD4